MNIALILSTLLVGASTVNPMNDGSAMVAPPNSDLPLPPIQKNTTSPDSESRTERAMKERKQAGATRPSGYSSNSGRTAANSRANNQNMAPLLPIAPTDSAAGSQAGYAYQYLPPTANAATAGAAGTAGGASNMGSPMNVPTSPTRARPGEAQSYASRQTAEAQNRRMAAARNSASAPAQSTSKAFSGVSGSSSSGISPYMNLFRSGNNNGTIDNYSTLVRPVLDQQRANLKFGADIHGLENSTHVQGLNIQQLNRETQTLQGVNATQYFMNYGDYYQGAR
jgi:hypothetical protein